MWAYKIVSYVLCPCILGFFSGSSHTDRWGDINLIREDTDRGPPFPLPPTPISMCHGIVICIIALQLVDERDRPEEKKKIMPSMINMTFPLSELYKCQRDVFKICKCASICMQVQKYEIPWGVSMCVIYSLTGLSPVRLTRNSMFTHYVKRLSTSLTWSACNTDRGIEREGGVGWGGGYTPKPCLHGLD